MPAESTQAVGHLREGRAAYPASPGERGAATERWAPSPVGSDEPELRGRSSEVPEERLTSPEAATAVWSAERIARLPVTVDIPTAGSMLSMGRTTAYQLVRRGEFPVPVLRVGRRYRVATSELRKLLGL